jgi:hypothetical protein
MVTLQALHYLTLGILVPALLDTFANTAELTYEGGPASVVMIMDWRELAGRPVAYAFNAAYSGDQFDASNDVPWRHLRGDPLRPWLIAVAWIAAAFVECAPFA